MRDPRERLKDVAESIAAIKPSTDHDRAAFASNELLQVWFLHHLQLIGEAARALRDEVRGLTPHIGLVRETPRVGYPS